MLVAPDSFKGWLPAGEVAEALARGLAAGGVDAADVCPVADGGDGTAEVLLGAFGGRFVDARATDPLGREIEARFALLGDGRRAVVEVAAASGLALVAQAERDPEAASSAGTGILMLEAARAGATEILVAPGASASTDGGAGALRVIEEGGGLEGGARVTVLCDVRTRFEEAVDRFAPQKGAIEEAVLERLRARLDAFADELAAFPARRGGRDPRGLELGGCGGGLSGGFWAGLGARLVPGAAFILDALGFDERMRAARAVVVGEGRLDSTTLEGKAVAEAAVRARQGGVPCFAVAAVDALDPFDARILDLQGVVVGGDVAGLEVAGQQLAKLII